jgi:hypothetical protein
MEQGWFTMGLVRITTMSDDECDCVKESSEYRLCFDVVVCGVFERSCVEGADVNGDVNVVLFERLELELLLRVEGADVGKAVWEKQSCNDRQDFRAD